LPGQTAGLENGTVKIGSGGKTTAGERDQRKQTRRGNRGGERGTILTKGIPQNVIVSHAAVRWSLGSTRKKRKARGGRNTGPGLEDYQSGEKNTALGGKRHKVRLAVVLQGRETGTGGGRNT